jgi:hypothetical protein
MDENFAYRVKKFGMPRDPIQLTSEQESRFKDILPYPIVEFLQECGLGTYFGGLFRFCDPKDLRSILALVFKTDSEFNHNNVHVVAHSAFGELWCWSEDYGILEIDLPTGMILCQRLTSGSGKLAAHEKDRHSSGIIPLREEDADYPDFMDEPMYERCVALLGAVDRTECFGFFPALAAAGWDSPGRSVEHVKKVKALEHYALLAQFSEFVIVSAKPSGYEVFRPIG